MFFAGKIVVMSNTLKLGIAGIRGIWGDSLTQENAEQFVRLFAEIMNVKKVVLGGDTRASHDDLKKSVITGLQKAGCQIIDYGVVPTPTLALMIRKESADGGIMMTASHNPPEWNGLKFFSSQGIFIHPTKMMELCNRYTSENLVIGEDKIKESTLTVSDTAIQTHVHEIMRHTPVDLIASQGMKVVIDMDNGAGTAIDPYFAHQFGLDATLLFEKTDGNFERNPEPVPGALTQLSETVRKNAAAVGFAQDPDADRLVLVDDRGNILSEDYTLALAMRYYLSKHPDPKGKLVVANLSTSRIFDDVAHEFGCKTLRTKIGEVYVASAIVEQDAIFGGEGSSSGVIWSDIGYVRDSVAGMALILSYMAETGKTISQLVDELPKYENIKDKKTVDNQEQVEEMLEKVKTIFANEDLDFTDGVKVNFENGWLHVRASNTEPLVRIFAEAVTRDEAQGWINQIVEK